MRSAKWHCEPHEGGWLIVASIGEAAFAYHLAKNAFREAHDAAWLFSSAIRSLSRAVLALGASHG